MNQYQKTPHVLGTRSFLLPPSCFLLPRFDTHWSRKECLGANCLGLGHTIVCVFSQVNIGSFAYGGIPFVVHSSTHAFHRVLQCVAVCCGALQCVAVCCSVLQCVAVCCSVSQCAAVCCSVLQCVAVCCSALQCVAVCCSVLQCVAMSCNELNKICAKTCVKARLVDCNTLHHTATHCNTLQHASLVARVVAVCFIDWFLVRDMTDSSMWHVLFPLRDTSMASMSLCFMTRLFTFAFHDSFLMSQRVMPDLTMWQDSFPLYDAQGL